MEKDARRKMPEDRMLFLYKEVGSCYCKQKSHANQ